MIYTYEGYTCVGFLFVGLFVFLFVCIGMTWYSSRLVICVCVERCFVFGVCVLVFVFSEKIEYSCIVVVW